MGSQLVLADAAVFQHVMEQGRHQALMIHMHVDEDIGDCQRVGDVGIAATSVLALVGALGELIGTHDPGDLIIVQITFQPFD